MRECFVHMAYLRTLITYFLPFIMTLFSINANSQSQSKLELQLTSVLEATQDISPGAILTVTSPTLNIKKSIGVANKADNTPMKPSYTLRIGSVTKTYLAALILLAEQDKKINLNTPISAYLPVWASDFLPKDYQPTVRQLLNHTSGLPDYYSTWFYLVDWDKQEPILPELVIDSLTGFEPLYTPGSEFSYSNTNYHLLSLALEHIYELPLEALLKTRLFLPLNLKNTYYSEHLPAGDVIHGYGAPTMPWGGALLPWVDTYDWRENSGPDGGMFASADDLMHWLHAIYAPSGVFSAVGKAMQENPIEQSKRVKQGLGTEILYSKNGDKIIGHTGAVDGYLTAAFYIPKLDASVVLHMNYTDHDGFSNTLSALFKALLSAAE